LSGGPDHPHPRHRRRGRRARPSGRQHLTVNVDTAVRPVTHVAAGGLYGADTGNKPPLSQLYPLRMNHFTQPPPGGQQPGNGATTPCCDGLQVAGKVTSAGAQQFYRCPTSTRTSPTAGSAGRTGSRRSAPWSRPASTPTGTTNADGYELWNEPDWTWNTAAAGPFNAGWTRTHRLIRSIDTATPIVGPSHSIYNHNWMVDFLTNARNTATLPDVIVWHELDNDSYLNVGAHVADYRCDTLQR
jgi:hypothetical protein